MTHVTVPDHLHHLTDMRINYWYYEEGDEVQAQTNLLEITSEEGPFILHTPQNGILDEVFFHLGDSITEHDMLATIVAPDSGIRAHHREEEAADDELSDIIIDEDTL